MTRDEKGRFKKGTTGNPNGRPPRATKQEYDDAFYSVVTVARFIKACEAQMSRAERGDIQAFNAIANRILPIIEKHDITSNGEKITSIVEIKPIDYRAAIAPLAPRPVGDSDTPGESENTFNGAEMG